MSLLPGTRYEVSEQRNRERIGLARFIQRGPNDVVANVE